ncbi:MAG TPA: hypothetical protein VGP73_10620 [Thermoanaerobaculia bacterium]
MKKGLVFGSALLILAVCSLPAHAASPEDSAAAAWAAIFAPAPPVAAQPQAQDVAARGHRLNVKSSSIAHCWDNTTRTCTGTSSSAVDSNCSAGQQGYCTGTDTGTLSCPTCPTGCSTTVTCSNGSRVSCSGTSDCFSVNNCYASCDGVLHWCAVHPSCPV